MMKTFGATSAEAIGWIRMVRPGSVIGPQQHFLEQFDGFNWAKMDGLLESCLGKRAGEGEAGSSAAKMARVCGQDVSTSKIPGIGQDQQWQCDTSAAEMARQVQQGMEEKARGMGRAHMQER